MAARNRAPLAKDIELQLCEARTAAFDDPQWLWELKLDGFRLLAAKENGRGKLLFRRGRDGTRQFPEVVEAIEKLPVDHCILDGELVIQDEQGHPIFQALLKRSTLTSAREIEATMRELPAAYFAFDLLALNGEDLRKLPVAERKKLLLEALPKDGRVRALDHVEAQGVALLQLVKSRGLEGVVGKKKSEPHRPGRGPDWVKVALTSVHDFAVCGYAEEFGALHLATYDGRQFVYAGKVGAGFGPRQQSLVKQQLVKATRDAPTVLGPLPDDKDVVWCVPELVAEIRYKSWLPPRPSPSGGTGLREPVLLRFRDDKTPEECPGKPGSTTLPPPKVQLSNPAKLLWPDDGISKQQLFDYYRAVSPWLLPYLKDRPLMTTRFPDGIKGKNFFQKSIPQSAPAFVKSVPFIDDKGLPNRQIVCDDLQTLEWLANLATIPLHLPAGRAGSLEQADWCVIDLDPKTAPFEHVITLALEARTLIEACGLPALVKTTGSSGLHVFIPLGAQVDHAFAIMLAELFAAHLVARHPKIATTERVVEKRQGRVYVDCYQNGRGRLIAGPFCVRPLPTAPVSMPLDWSEVNGALHPRQFTISNAIQRLEAKGDPLSSLLKTAPDLARALALSQKL